MIDISFLCKFYELSKIKTTQLHFTSIYLQLSLGEIQLKLLKIKRNSYTSKIIKTINVSYCSKYNHRKCNLNCHKITSTK